MTLVIRETSGDDLTPHMKPNRSILLRRGRSNSIRVNGEHYINDVRNIHLLEPNEDGSYDVEMKVQYSEKDNGVTIYIHNVTKMVVEWMGWSHKFPSYDGYKADIDNLANR